MANDLPTVAFLGCGNMGGAILTALLAANPRPVSKALACDPDEAKRSAFPDAEPVDDATYAVSRADVVLLAVKPQLMAEVLAPVAATSSGKLFISVAAGLTSSKLASLLPGGRIVRTMPNTPLLAGRGAVAISRGEGATEADVATAKSLFPGCLIEELDESQMDAATAVHGSGPAYFFAFVEALAAAGAKVGLPPDVADRLARETLVGAAALLDQSGEAPAELRRRVTSPGGTTAAALDAFTAGNLNDLVESAVAAAERRGRDLGA